MERNPDPKGDTTLKNLGHGDTMTRPTAEREDQ